MRNILLMVFLVALTLSGCQTSPNEAVVPPVMDTGIDPQSWALIPAGEFLMGLHMHETLVDYDYEIMVTDVTNSQYVAYLNEALARGTVKVVRNQVVGYYPGDEFHGYRHEEEIPAGDYLHVPLDDPGLRLKFDGQAFRVQPEYASHPMALITWFGAKTYCDFSGWRLPGESEWEKAARGGDGRPFPWGDKITPQNANYYSSFDIFEKTFGKLGGTTPVGFYNGRTYTEFETGDSRSPYGLYDMAGNVWQWTSDVYVGQHYRYMRGGSFQNYGYNLRVWTRNNASPSYYSPAVGFRCARDK